MQSLKPSPQAAAAELLRRRRARASLTEYARFIEVPGAPVSDAEDEERFTPVETVLAAHHILICEATQRCIKRRNGRAMLLLPPGSAKSTYATVVGSTWALGETPGFKVIGVSYGSDLMLKFGRRMRSVCRQSAFEILFDCQINSENSSANEWSLTNGSEYMGGGILSGITGNRADFIPIDDVVKGRLEAESEVTRKRIIEAYQDDVLTRLKPGGSIMLTNTRWHEGDLAGSILPEGYAGESGMIECRDGNTWEVLCVPAKCNRHDDPLGRKIGEYIWPEWFGPEHWAQFERIPRTWSALYQQQPTPDEGAYFKSEWLQTVDRLPPIDTMRFYGGSDYAVTSDGGDYTCHAVIGLDPDGRMYLVDLWRKQAASDEWVEAWCDLVKKWRPMGWAEETGQIRSGVGPWLERRARERAAYCVREQFPTRGDKAVRAQSIRGRMAMNGLRIVKDAPWRSDFVSELLRFPAGVHDDQCLVEGTQISMSDGTKQPIEKVNVGDSVATPIGPCKVTASAITSEAATVFRVTTTDGAIITGTANHPVYVVGRGFVRIDAINIMDQIAMEDLCEEVLQKQKFLNTTEIVTGVIQTASMSIIGAIFTLLSRAVDFCIGTYGKMFLAQSRRGLKSTILMAIRPIILSKTSLVWIKKHIVCSTQCWERDLKNNYLIWMRSGLKPQSGTQATPENSGTPKTEKLHGLGVKQLIRNVPPAGRIFPLFSNARNIAVVAANSVGKTVEGLKRGISFKAAQLCNAFVAIGKFRQSGPMSRNIAQKPAGCVIAVEELSEKARVRNLTVEHAHAFYANGFLTHNCDAIGLVGQLMDKMIVGQKPKDDDGVKTVGYRPFERRSKTTSAALL